MQTSVPTIPTNPDPLGILASFTEVQKSWLAHPNVFADQYWKLLAKAWSSDSWQYWMTGQFYNDMIWNSDSDSSLPFFDPGNNPALDTLKEMHEMTSSWLAETIAETPDLSEKTRKRATFWSRQILNAVSPSNFLMTNSDAQKRLFETQGTSVIEGWNQFLADSKRGVISLVEEDAFEVGKDLATTPGGVVFRNELFELIQFTPTTKKVHEVPIVIVSPWINKYYILDLTSKKSMIKYLVDQGYTVFITSWKNPTSEMRNTKMDDYLIKGAFEAVNVAREICHVPQVHLTGYCIGGTLVSALMAWLNQAVADGQLDTMPVAHWTLFTTLIDFEDPGEIDVFIDENAVQHVEKKMVDKGYLDGNDLGMSFRMLRSESLIWNYFVNNYLCGDAPQAFDVLYWNMDTTRLPEAMHKQYLRDLYLDNKLCKPGALKIAGRGLDMSVVTQPLYAVGTEQDHIVPWKEAFKSTSAVSSPVRFALATSGHILGVVSPPVEPPKRAYWVADVDKSLTAEKWCKGTEQAPGTWWVDWIAWLAPQCGAKVAPKDLGGEHYPVLAPAPGEYVLEK